MDEDQERQESIPAAPLFKKKSAEYPRIGISEDEMRIIPIFITLRLSYLHDNLYSLSVSVPIPLPVSQQA